MNSKEKAARKFKRQTQAIRDIDQAAKVLGWHTAVRDRDGVVEGLIVGTQALIEEVLEASKSIENKDE